MSPIQVTIELTPEICQAIIDYHAQCVYGAMTGGLGAASGALETLGNELLKQLPFTDPDSINNAVEQAFLPAARPEKKKATIPGSFRERIFDRDGWQCLHCGSTEHLTVDHIIPESKGGPTTEDNCQTLCKRCNSRKGTAKNQPPETVTAS